MENVINANTQKAVKKITMYDVKRVLGKTGHMILLLAEVAIAAFLMSIALTFEGDVPARLVLLASGQAAPTLRDLLASPLLFAPLMVYAAAIQAARCITGRSMPGAKAVLYISRALALAIVGCTTIDLVITFLKEGNATLFVVGSIASFVITVVAYCYLLSVVRNVKLLSPVNNPMLSVLLLSLAIYLQITLSLLAFLAIMLVLSLLCLYIVLSIAATPTRRYYY